MSDDITMWQTLAITTLVWCLCCLPSLFLTPVNSVFKYLACVVIYPKVRLTWAGIQGCIPKLGTLLETRLYMNVFLLYSVVWWLWPRWRRMCRALNPVFVRGFGTYLDKKALWDYTKNCTSYIPFQNGYCTWRDLQWMWKNHLYREYRTFKTSNIIGCHIRSCLERTSRLLAGFAVLVGRCKLIGHIHTKTQALVWRMTSYHIRLHFRFWSYVAQGVCQMVITNPEHYMVGSHRDVLEKHIPKFIIYRCLPLRKMSKLWGSFNNLDLPAWLRPTAFSLYIHIFGCKLHEASITDLKHYTNLGKFFRRSLKPDLRPIDMAHDVTSPADGQVVHAGPVDGGVLEQIKGVTYSIISFFGGDTNFMSSTGNRHGKIEAEGNPEVSDGSVDRMESSANAALPFVEYYTPSVNFNVDFSCCQITDEEADKCNFEFSQSEESIIKDNPLQSQDMNECGDKNASSDNAMSAVQMNNHYGIQSTLDNHIVNAESDFAKNLVLNPKNVLHQLIVYLAPGDYHRFHSPVDWTVHHRRHFTGNLYGVHPSIVQWLQGVFVMNERVVYTGRWKHGFFSMTAVGATNVGSINVFFDETLKTNGSMPHTQAYSEMDFRASRKKVLLKRGQLFGEFNLGSTIVLVYEAPANFQLRVDCGDRVKYGQGLQSHKDKIHKKKRKRNLKF